MISTDLGVVTAYGYARDHDWQGTEDEFGEYLANVATNAQAAANSAAAAASSAAIAQELIGKSVKGLGISLTPERIASSYSLYGDLNNIGTTGCPNNVVLRYANFTSENAIAHAPQTPFNGHIISCGVSDASNFGVQIAINDSGIMWHRKFYPTGEWEQDISMSQIPQLISDMALVDGLKISLTPERVAEGATYEQYSDLNNIGITGSLNNTILRYTGFTSSNAIANAPKTPFNGIVVSLSVNKTSNFGLQIAIDEYANAVWMRYFVPNVSSSLKWLLIGGEELYNVSTAAALFEILTTKDTATIYLAPGVYDLYTGLYENVILADNYDRHFATGNIKLYGNNSTIKIHVPQSVAEVHKNSANMTSILDLRCSAEIHNVTFDCINTRYCVHYESLDEETAYYNKLVFNNCRFIYERTVSDLNANCVGIGANLGQIFEFNNCIFKNSVKGGIYIHTRDYNIGSLNINNCIFDCAWYGVVLSQYTGNELPCDVDIVNSLVGLLLVQSQGGRTSLQWRIKTINSSFELSNVSGYNYLYAPEDYSTISTN